MRNTICRLMGPCLLMAALCASAAEPNRLVPPGQSVAGKTQQDWSREWWQWASAFDDDDSPVADKTGSRCHLAQQGDVWFLAGTYGSKRTIRTCTVPAGKHLFFPLINYVFFPRGDFPTSCERLKANAASLTDGPLALVLEVDGEVLDGLEAHRQATGDCFDLAERTGGGLFPSAANGYYVMLKPLRRGKHTLNFGGILPAMTQAVTYTLIVE